MRGMAQEIRRIEKEFVLRDLRDTQAIIHLHYQNKRFASRLVAYTDKVLTLEVVEEGPKFEKGPKASLYFRFRGIPFVCKSGYISSEKNHHTFMIPPLMYRDLTRSYERIDANKKMSVHIVIDGEHLDINFPVSASYYEPEMPKKGHNFDAPKIADLLKAFRERCATFSSDNNVTLFRERSPSYAIERLVATSGKIMALPFEDLSHFATIDSKLSFIKPNDIDWIASETNADPAVLRTELHKHIELMTVRRIFHELYIPVLYYEYVIGYIYIMRADKQAEAFTQEQVEMVQQFSHLFAYSLKIGGHLKSKQPAKEASPHFVLIDISASGLLFSYPLDAQPLKLHADIDLQVKTDHGLLPFRGRVVRQFRDGGQCYVGVQFIDLSDASKRRLLKHLYGNDYDGEIEIR